MLTPRNYSQLNSLFDVKTGKSYVNMVKKGNLREILNFTGVFLDRL